MLGCGRRGVAMECNAKYARGWDGRKERGRREGATQVANKALNMGQERWFKLLAVLERDALKRLCHTPVRPASAALLRPIASALLENQPSATPPCSSNTDHI